VNFLCLLGWSPKDDREQMTRQALTDAFSFEGINHSNAVVNFKEEDPFDPKAAWLNAEHIRALPVDELAEKLLPFLCKAGLKAKPESVLRVAPLVRERIKLLSDVVGIADFFFVDELPPYDPNELIPQKGDRAMALAVLQRARVDLANTEFKHDPLDATLRAASQELKIKAGQMFTPIRVAVCGRKNAPPLFETLEVLGRETSLQRIDRAIEMLQ
jgi:glutamyl-tRNA synthetase